MSTGPVSGGSSAGNASTSSRIARAQAEADRRSQPFRDEAANGSPEVQEALLGVRFTAEVARQQAARIAYAQQQGDMDAISAIAADPFGTDFGPENPAELLLTSPPTLAALQVNPGIGPQLAALAESPDPAVQARLDEIAQGLVADVVADQLSESAGQDPDAVLSAMTREVGGLAELTGLGPQLDAAFQAGMHEAAGRLLDEGVAVEDLQANPSLARTIGRLREGNDEARMRLRDAVTTWVGDAMSAHLGGASEMSAENYQREMTNFLARIRGAAEATGLGAEFRLAAASAIQAHVERGGSPDVAIAASPAELVSAAFDGGAEAASDAVAALLIMPDEALPARQAMELPAQ